MTHIRRWLLVTAVIPILAFAPAAEAGLLVNSVPASSCASQPLERPFVRWLDLARYTLVPDGTFERNAAGWTRSGSSVVSGNEPFYVHGRNESRSLRLPGGSSATSPAMCVGILHPTLRLFARNTGGLLAPLKVEVLFEDAGGRVRSLAIGNLLSGSAWKPTLPHLVVANLLPLLPGQNTAVAFRFTAAPKSTWQIDDVYVDPARKN